MRALIVSADHFEDSELLVPFYRLEEEGLEVDVASIARGKIHGKHGYEVVVDKAMRDVSADDYDLLVLPGGKAPATLRKEQAAVAIAQDFMRRNKPVAAICHGPQILITAGVMQGRRATCYHSVAEELQAAGALYEDREVVVDDKLVTSRHPADLPAFMREMVRLLKSAR
ncbi:MAG: type 1 glutamine amidotransferase domain-containing protein [Thiobacillus sp.]